MERFSYRQGQDSLNLKVDFLDLKISKVSEDFVTSRV